MKDGGFESTPGDRRGVVFIGDLDGNVYALDLATGKERWKKKLDTGFTSAAAVRDKRLCIGDIDGRLHCLDAVEATQCGRLRRRRRSVPGRTSTATTCCSVPRTARCTA